MIRRLGLIALGLLLVLGVDTPAWGQGQTTGSIRGQVVSSDGAPVANAQVIARNVETGLSRGTLTDSEGRYTVFLLPSGRYTVQAQSLGYSPASAEEVRVIIGEATPVDLALTTQAVAVEGIVVTGDQARVDPTQGGVVQTVTPEQVESLPTPGRDFTDLINLSPLVSPQPGVGTGGQFSIGGARSSGTNVQVDGVDANNVFFGENRGSSRTPFAFSLESVKELQLITNGFDVEYGNYVGGVVNAVTKGGTNEFRGGAFTFLRGESLTGDDFEGRSPDDFNSWQFGANFSGPIVRDRLHFFVSADAQLKDTPLFPASDFSADTVDAVVAALRQKGLANPERFFDRTEQAEDNVVLFGRLDWQISDRHRLTLRQNYSDFEQTNDRINQDEATTHGGPFRNEVWSTVAELNSGLGANLFNTLRFQWSNEDRPRVPNEPGGFLPEIEIEVEDDELEFGGDGIIFRNRLEESKLQLVDNLTFLMGNHTLKVGTNTSWVNTTNTFWLLGNGEYEFETVRDRATGRVTSGFENFLAGTPTEYIRFVRECPVPLVENFAGQRVICPEPNVPAATFANVEYSFYAQDAWQMTDRLLVTAGLRYGGTAFADDPREIPEVEAAFGVETGVVPDFTGVSPRLAFAYDLGDDQEAVLRGGVGLLIGRTPTVLAGNVFQADQALRRISCVGDAIPAFDLEQLLADPTGLNNPAACAGSARQGSPEHAVFSPDFELPRTLKANLGYERVLWTATKIGIDVIYSRTENNFRVQDVNLADTMFTLASENDRPVFVPRARYNPDFISFGSYFGNRDFERVYRNVSDGEARAWNVALELDQRVRDDLQFGARYAYTSAYDNGTFACCTSSEGFDEPTAGDPNFIGDPGDDVDGLWGPSDSERRHTVVVNFLYRGPFGINASGIWRSQSGTPWTPAVRGDLNADGVSYNDRPFISPDLQFVGDTPAEQAQERALLQRVIDENACLQDQVGRIAARNSCRNPWFHSVDLRLAKEFQTVRGQRFEVLADIFNVLNGLNDDWGRYMQVFGDDDLLIGEGFDPATGQVIYSVNDEFGELEPVGFDPFQFQVQLGVRYRF